MIDFGHILLGRRDIIAVCGFYPYEGCNGVTVEGWVKRKKGTFPVNLVSGLNVKTTPNFKTPTRLLRATFGPLKIPFSKRCDRRYVLVNEHCS